MKNEARGQLGESTIRPEAAGVARELLDRLPPRASRGPGPGVGGARGHQPAGLRRSLGSRQVIHVWRKIEATEYDQAV
jgi:hypothetical protein